MNLNDYNQLVGQRIEVTAFTEEQIAGRIKMREGAGLGPLAKESLDRFGGRKGTVVAYFSHIEEKYHWARPAVLIEFDDGEFTEIGLNRVRRIK